MPIICAASGASVPAARAGGPACSVSDLAILCSATAGDAAKAIAILYVGHWSGDLHQPLHISFADDRGGNSIGAAGACSGRFAASLHSVWDTCDVEDADLPGTDRVARARAAAAILNGSITDWPALTGCARSPGNGHGESFQGHHRRQRGYCIRKAGICRYSDRTRNFSPRRSAAHKSVDNAYLDRPGRCTRPA